MAKYLVKQTIWSRQHSRSFGVGDTVELVDDGTIKLDLLVNKGVLEIITEPTEVSNGTKRIKRPNNH
jgi:hypothetical protein